MKQTMANFIGGFGIGCAVEIAHPGIGFTWQWFIALCVGSVLVVIGNKMAKQL